MGHKQGKKVTASHTTVTEISEKVVDFLEKDIGVKKISLGVIVNGGFSKSSNWTVKITDQTTCLVIKTTQSGASQEIRVWTNSLEDKQQVKENLCRFVREKRWFLRFGFFETNP